MTAAGKAAATACKDKQQPDYGCAMAASPLQELVTQCVLLPCLPGMYNRKQQVPDTIIGAKGANSLILIHEALGVQVSQSGSQHAVDAGLGCKAVAHNHEAVANKDHFIQLVGLLHEDRGGLQVGCFAGCSQAVIQVFIIWLWKCNLQRPGVSSSEVGCNNTLLTDCGRSQGLSP